MLKNRVVDYTEFMAVTEALHRRFMGTTFNGKVYVERGWHIVHAKFYLSPIYAPIVARVLV